MPISSTTCQWDVIAWSSRLERLQTYPHTIPDAFVLDGTYTKVNAYLVPDLLFSAQVYERAGRGARPLNGVSLALARSGDPATKPEPVTTDTRGYASLTLAKEGTYAVVPRLAGYKAARSVSVAISPTGTNHANIELERDTTPPPPTVFDLAIVAKTDSKTPIHGADVTVTPQGEQPGPSAVTPGTTDLSGSYTAQGLKAGSYTVQVSMKGYKAASTPPTVVLTKNDRGDRYGDTGDRRTCSTWSARSSDAGDRRRVTVRGVVGGVSGSRLRQLTAVGLELGYWVLQISKSDINRATSRSRITGVAASRSPHGEPPPPTPVPVDPPIVITLAADAGRPADALVTVPNVTAQSSPPSEHADGRRFEGSTRRRTQTSA